MRLCVAMMLGVFLCASPASALSKHRCYDAARAFVVPLLLGNFDEMPPTEVEKPGGWSEWMATEFAAPGAFSVFSIVTQQRVGGGCRVSVRIRKTGGETYAIFARLDGNGHVTEVTSLRESLGARKRELSETLAEIERVLPSVRTGSADDLAVLPLLRRLSRTARKARSDVDEYIRALEDPPL
jgi:hypothetical protein